MKPVTLIGHAHACPLHGAGQVVSGSAVMEVNGRGVARVGDLTSCGAVIQTGSAGFTSDGRAVACAGDVTSHGGVLIEGEGVFQVD